MRTRRGGACRHPVSLLSILALALLPRAEARAQEAPAIPLTEGNAGAEPAPAPAPVPIRQQLETIIVTAQKREQSAQEIPLSVTPIKGETLREAGTFDASGLEKNAPNIEIDLDAQDPIISIRGFTSDPNDVGFEPAVGLYLDDVSLGRSEFISDGLYDIGRVEVLRGSQGTLFGKNTIAGVIGFSSVEPESNWRGDIQTALDGFGDEHTELAQNIPLGDAGSLRFSGTLGHHLGDIENSKLNRKEGEFAQQAGRAKLALFPSDALTVRLSSQVSRTRGNYGPIQLYDVPQSVTDFARKYDPAFEDNPFDRHTSEDFPGFADRDSNVSRLRVDYDFGPAWGARKLDSTLIAAYADLDLSAKIDADASPAALVVTDYALDYRQRSLEWRLAGDSASLFGLGRDVEFLFGLFAFQTRIKTRLDQIAGDDLVAFGASPAGIAALGGPDLSAVSPLLALLPAAPGVPLDDKLFRHFSQKSDSEAAFGQLTWNFYEAWSAILGGRITEERKSGDFHVATEGPGLIAAIVGARPFDADLHRSELDVSPRLGIDYRWSEKINLFFTATRGFEGGGYNADANTSDDLQFRPETATSYEAGFKATWLGGTLRTNLAVYDTRVSDLQVVFLQGNSLEVGNAAKVQLRGLEAEFNWLPAIRWLRLDGAVGVSKARYLDYDDAPPTDAQSDNHQKSQDLSGRTLPNAPDLSVILTPSVRWPLPFGRDLGVEFSVNAVYRGDQYSATNLDSHTLQRGYWLLDSNLFLGRRDRRYGAILSGKNLTDQKALVMARDNAVYHDSYENQQIARLSLQLSLIANW